MGILLEKSLAGDPFSFLSDSDKSFSPLSFFNWKNFFVVVNGKTFEVLIVFF